MSIRREDVDAGRIDFSDVAEPGALPIEPIHPGAILREDWIEPLGLSVYQLARSLGVERSRLGEIMHGRRAITADTALRLARYFGTDAQSWMNLQARYDLEVALREAGRRIEKEVQPRAAA